MMRFGSAIVDGLGEAAGVPERDAAAVAGELLTQLETQLGAQAPDLLLFFNASAATTPLHGRDVARLLREGCEARWAGCAPVVVGASWGSIGPGTGVIGGSYTGSGDDDDGDGETVVCADERQEAAALAVLGAHLPGVAVLPFHASPTHDGLPTLVRGSWPELALLPEAEAPHVLLLTDPSPIGMGGYSDTMLRYFDNILPFSTKVGGLVPGGGTEDNHACAQEKRMQTHSRAWHMKCSGLISLESDGGEVSIGTQGCAGVVLHGNLEVDTLVCQGRLRRIVCMHD